MIDGIRQKRGMLIGYLMKQTDHLLTVIKGQTRRKIKRVNKNIMYDYDEKISEEVMIDMKN